MGEGGREVNFLPYHRFEIASPMTPSEAHRALAGHVEPEKWFRWRWPSSANDDKFEGELHEGGFHIRRVIGYNNSFLPVVDGEITSAARGSRITIRMRPFVFVFIFLTFWVLGAISSLTSAMWPLGLAMLLFLYGMTMGAFWFEANKQEQVLRAIFRDQPVPATPKIVS